MLDRHHAEFLNLYINELKTVLIPGIETSITEEIERAKKSIDSDSESFPQPDITKAFYASLAQAKRNKRDVCLENSKKAHQEKFKKLQAKRKSKASSKVKGGETKSNPVSEPSSKPAKHHAVKKHDSHAGRSSSDTDRDYHRSHRGRFYGKKRGSKHHHRGHRGRHHYSHPSTQECGCHDCTTARYRDRKHHR